MKDQLLKEKGTLPEQVMMNDSRSVRISANKITKKKKKVLKVLKKNRTCKNKRWLRKSTPKEALRTQTTLLRKRFAEKNNWRWCSSTKHCKKGSLQRELRSAEKKRTNQKKKNVRTIKMIPWKGAGSEDQLHGLINYNQKERLKRTDTNNMKA